jgi:hypothetical protein
VPLAFYILGAMGLLLVAADGRERRNRALWLAGLCASLGAWTKNEGFLFFGLLMGVLLVRELRACGLSGAWTSWCPVALGAAPVMGVVLWFKLVLAPGGSPFLSSSAGETIARLGEPERYWKVAASFLGEAVGLGSGLAHPLVMLAILAAVFRWRPEVRHRRWAATTALTLCLLGVAFYATYVATRLPLEWLLSTSLDRLYAQLWPSTVLLFFVVLRRPEETLTAPAGPRSTEKRKRERARRG